MPTRLPPRAFAAALVLLLHLGLGSLLLKGRDLPEGTPAVLVMRLIEARPVPAPRAPRVKANAMAPLAPSRLPIPGLEAPADLPAQGPPETLQPQADAAPPAAAPRPLDLRLPPTPRAFQGPPTLHDQIRADPRTNSPRESADERMAAALGGKGWQVIELEGGARKVMGPFGECYISRPSLVNELQDHPLAGKVPNKIFGCGGIEKGSLKHERPK